MNRIGSVLMGRRKMIDREKVMAGLELCTNISQDGCLMLCPYKDEKDETYSGFCEQVLKQEALALLKEQEAVEPKLSMSGLWYECPVCHRHLLKDKDNYCARCGKAVKWNA